MERLLPTDTVKLLGRIGKIGDALDAPVYVVGGLPRDLFLGRPSADIDVMVEGEARALGRRLARALEAALESDNTFLTCKLLLSRDRHIDIATARTETYEHPGALPKVQPALAADELGRRDFSINALAIRLNAAQFGSVLDPFGGIDDIRAGLVRVLHEESFVDDPTRVFRAVRFAGRYGLRLATRTEQLALTAVASGAVDGISADRRRDEIVALLSEHRPTRGLAMLADCGGLRFINAAVRLTPEVERVMERIAGVTSEGLALLHTETAHKETASPPDLWMLRAAALLEQLGPARAAWTCERLKLTAVATKYIIAAIEHARPAARAMEDTGDVPPSGIHSTFAQLPLSVPLLALALARSPRARRRIHCYLHTLRHAAADITGDDLLAEGCPAGPAFAGALSAALYAKLDGRAETREQQMAVALSTLEKDSPTHAP